MLGRGDEDGIDGGIVQELAVIRAGLRGGGEFGCVSEAAGVDVGEGGELGAGAGDGFAGELRAAVAHADDADAKAVVGAEDTSGETTGETRGHVADEFSSGLHDSIQV